jgi:DNA repair protein RadA/Sms
MVLAVLERRARLPVGGREAYLSTVGGVRIGEPAADLAVALSVASSVVDRALPAQAVAFGEVGLAGELRPVSGMPRRLAEAARLGFRTAFTPRGVLGSGPVPGGLRVVEVGDVASAVLAALDVPARSA